MLGKRPRPAFLRTASKSQLMLPSYGVVDRSPHPPDSKPFPHRVVIGFTLGSSECRHPNPNPNLPCESPRSVLEVNALSVPIHNHLQKLSAARSPRSFLGSLLYGSSYLQAPATECGVGLGIVAAMEAEESVTESSRKASFKSDPIAIIGRCRAPLLKKRGNHGQNAEFLPGGYKNVGRYGGGGGKGDERYPNEEVKAAKRSIFSAASPATESDSYGVERMNFLSFCHLCKRALSQGNDIYMYKGDQAFCSMECRHQQMALDDRKERLSATAAVNCFGAKSTPPRHSRAWAIAPAAVA